MEDNVLTRIKALEIAHGEWRPDTDTTETVLARAEAFLRFLSDEGKSDHAKSLT